MHVQADHRPAVLEDDVLRCDFGRRGLMNVAIEGLPVLINKPAVFGQVKADGVRQAVMAIPLAWVVPGRSAWRIS